MFQMENNLDNMDTRSRSSGHSLMYSGDCGGPPALVSTPSEGSEVCTHTICDNMSEIGVCDVSTQCNFSTFSPVLCKDLVPSLSDYQIEREFLYLNFKNDNYTITEKRDLIDHKLSVDIDNSILQSKEIIKRFSCTLLEAEACLTKVGTDMNIAQDILCDLKTLKEVPPTDIVSTNNCIVGEPVSFLNCTVEDISVDDVINSLNFDKIGNRYVAYFGSIPYEYSGKSHSPCKYPDISFFDKMFKTISATNKHFTRENFTCVATLYPDGHSMIPFHSDSESSIKSDSEIYCVSIGADRSLLVASTADPKTEIGYNLKHGTVYTMTAASQFEWKHSVPAAPHITKPRVSFTFRELEDKLRDIDTEPHLPSVKNPLNAGFGTTDNSPQATVVPPVHRPPIINSNKAKVLFLTDSILKTFNDKSFGPDFVCNKRPLYKITDIDNYADEFASHNYVFISAGINDLSRYGYTAEHLTYVMRNKIKNLCSAFPETIFIFRALIPTKHTWLNVAVDTFNVNMFSDSVKTFNFNFFDTYTINRNPNLLDGKDRNGIHLSHSIIQYLSSQITLHITHLWNHYSHTREVWPLRPFYREILHRERVYGCW